MERVVFPFLMETPKNPNGISIYYVAQGVIREAARRNDVTMLLYHPNHLPSIEEYWDVPTSDTVVPVPFIEDKLTAPTLGYANASMSKISSRKDYFTVLNQKVTASTMLSRLLCKAFVGFHPVMVNWALVGDFGEPHFTLFPFAKKEALLSYMLCWNIFVSKGQLSRTKVEIAHMFGASAAAEFVKRSTFVSHGADCDAVSSVKQAEVKDKFVLLYGGRPASHKRIDLMVDICRQMFSAGRKVQLELFLIEERAMGAEETSNTYEKEPFVRVHRNRPLSEFHSMCRRADAFIAASTAEAYGISYVEMMAGGAVGVFVDRPWVHSIVPDGYRFVCKDGAAAAVAIRELYQNKKLREETSAELKRFVHQHHDKKAHDKKMVDLMAALTTAVANKKKPKGWDDVWGSRS